MNKDIIFFIVFVVFAYIIGKYKLLPYFAAKKMLKESKDSKKDSGNTAPVQMPFPYSYAGLPVIPAQPQPEMPSRKDMYIELRTIATDVSMEDLAHAVDGAAADMFVTLRNRGICPNQFNVVRIGEGFLLAYVTYIL